MVDPVAVWQYLRARFDVSRRNDRGVITTEFAVVVFLVVAGAIVVVGILMNAAKDNADNVEVPSQNPPQQQEP